MRLNKLQKTVVAALEDIKAREIVVLDARPLTAMFDAIIIASADSNRQTRALSRKVQEKVKEIGERVMGVEGELEGDWVLLDLGSVVVHIMQPAVRAYYELESLWGQGKMRPAVSQRNQLRRKKPRSAQ